MLKIVFFGTPDYVLPIVEFLHKSFKDKSGVSPIAAVVTQNPKPAGRKQLLEYSPIDTWAHKRGIQKFHQGKDILKDGIDADIGVLASYGEILSKEVINHFPKGIINIHPSLLPKYRGSSPVQAAITTGEKTTGVTFTKMDEDLDKGELISQFKEDIRDSDTTNSLRKRLYEKSAEVIKELLPAYIQGKITPKKLSDHPGTFTTRLTKSDAYIPPEYIQNAINGTASNKKWEIGFIKNYEVIPTSEVLERFVRAMQTWPTAWTEVQIGTTSKKLKIHNAHTVDDKLILDEVQLEGKNLVTYKQFVEGYAAAVFV